jgi:hypothetical protein
MSQGNHSNANRTALLVLADKTITAQGDQLAQLQRSAVAQLAAVPQMERQAAAHAILAGMSLHRVKASLPHGEFGKWLKQIPTGGGNAEDQKRTSGSFLNVTERQCQFYMKLATTFVAKAKVTAPDVLALPGDQTQLALEGGEGEARVFFSKLSKFVGSKSLNELLAEHEIKTGKKLGGKREAGETDEDAPPAVPTAEDLAAQAKTELSDWLEQGRQLLITDNVCSRLEAQDLQSFAGALDAMLAHWKRGARTILAAAGEAEVVEPINDINCE